MPWLLLPCAAEEQFVEVLAKRKEAALAAALPAVSPLFQQDLIIDIEVQRVTPRVWRRFKVSGGMTLAVLQDKVGRGCWAGRDRTGHVAHSVALAVRPCAGYRTVTRTVD